MFLNNQQVTEEIKKFLETNDNENMTTQNLWDAVKAVLKSEVYSNTFLPQETRKTLNRQPNFTPKTTGKRRIKKKTKPTLVEEIMKIQAEINEKEMKETIVKINKTKSCFFEKINKIDKPDSSRKKERRIKSTKLEMKRERLQQTMQKYEGL